MFIIKKLTFSNHIIFSFLFALIFIFANTSAVDANNIELSAESAILIDQDTGRVLYSKEKDKKSFPASTTKILTALVAMDYLNMDEIYIIGSEINEVPWDSSKAGHKIGESILGINLIRGLIIPSGNETACVVAKIVAIKHTGEENIPYFEAETIFADLMNEKARAIGANNSNFVNPHGYHNENHYTTANDIALISKEAIKIDVIKEIVTEKLFEGNGAGNKETSEMLTQNYKWQSHNLLINSKDYFYPYANGIKTGFTNEAGDCVSASAEKDDKKLIAVVLNSKDPGRWIDAKALFEYGFNNFNFETIVKSDTIVQTLKVNNPRLGDSPTIDLFIDESFTALYSKSEIEQMEFEVVLDEDKLIVPEGQTEKHIKTPVSKGEEIGVYKVKFNNEVIFETKILSASDAQERTLKTDIDHYITTVKTNAFTVSAIPYWLGIIGFFIIVGFIVSLIKRNSNKKGIRFR